MLPGAVCEEFLPCADGVDFSNVSLERGCTFIVKPYGIHHHIEEVSDFLLNAAFLVVCSGNLLDQLRERLHVVVTDLGDGSPHRVFLRLGIEVCPMSGGVSCEVVTCADSCVHVGVIDSGRLDRCPSATCRNHHGGAEDENPCFHCINNLEFVLSHCFLLQSYCDL